MPGIKADFVNPLENVLGISIDNMHTLVVGVWNEWNGMVEWITGMEHWNGLIQDPNACI